MLYKIKNIVLVLFLVGIFTSCKNQEAPKKEASLQRPNIVFIMTDDQSYKAISAYNDHLIKTPNIDRIAEEGMLFTNATTTNALCAPSRAVILTGKHSHINGKVNNITEFDTTNLTFPQLLQDADYQTAMFGKLHFGNKPVGFDEFKILPGQGSYYNPRFITKEGDTTITGYVTDIITDLTINWLDNGRDKEKPFLLMYLHKAPHRPWLPAPRHYKKFTKKEFPLPKTLFDDYSQHGTAAKEAEMNILEHMIVAYDNKIKDSIIQKLGIQEPNYGNATARMNPEQKAKWDSIYLPISKEFAKMYPDMSNRELMKWKYQRYMQDYLATIAAVDENVGRLLDYLDQNGLAENTVVIYTSDQGFYIGEHGWFDKRFMYKESFRTPLLIKWPNKITPGTTQDEMVQNLDFAQTFLDMAGVKAPGDMQGVSLLPVLTGEKEELDRDVVYYHYYEYPGAHSVKRHYGIATETYKLIHFYYDVDEWELYDLKNDPLEHHNVFYDPEYTEVKKIMIKKLKEVRKKYGNSKELDQYYINLYKKRNKNRNE